MNARIELAPEAAATNGKARATMSRTQEKEAISNEVDRVRAMLRIMADLGMHGPRDTVELDAEAFVELNEELSDRLKAISDRILKL